MNEKMIHFGISISPKKRGLKLSRDNYAEISNRSSFSSIYQHALKIGDEKMIEPNSDIYADKEGIIYTDSWCQKHLEEVMQNFDLNMQFFKKLDKAKFNNEVTKFIKKTKFVEITDLSDFSCPGYYAMILDEYCQVYIGTSQDIRTRVRQHWNGHNSKFDRLIFGSVTKSRLSINSFRALDTTRILVYPNIKTFDKENGFIKCFSDEFICNRIDGGRIADMEFGMLSAVTSIKTRDLKII